MTDELNDDLIERVAGALRERGGAGPGFDARVMAAVRAVRPSPVRSVLAWLMRPQPMAVSPIGAGMGVAAVTLLIVGVAMLAPRIHTSDPGGRDLVPEAAAHGEVIRFVFAAPAARSVALVGSFNSWNPEATPLHRTDGTGVWVVDVPLGPGRHEYGFLVDGGQWHPDPTAPRGVANEYGWPNSVILVPVRQS